MTGETRVARMRPKKKDAGHSVVEMQETYGSYGRPIRFRLKCECGKTFGSKQTRDRTYYAYSAHIKQVSK